MDDVAIAAPAGVVWDRPVMPPDRARQCAAARMAPRPRIIIGFAIRLLFVALLLALAGAGALPSASAQSAGTQTAVAATEAAATGAAAAKAATEAAAKAATEAQATEAAATEAAAKQAAATKVAAAEEAGQQGGGATGPTAILLDPPMAFFIVLALLALAAFVLWWIFSYLRDSRADYYTTVREFARKGVFFNPVLVATTAPMGPLQEAAARAGAPAPEPKTFALTGPGVMPPGQKAEFKALLNGAPAKETVWSVEAPAAGLPDAGVTLSATEGEAVMVEAAKQGAFVLVATLPGDPELSVRTQVTVVEPVATAEKLPSLPFIGQGFGSLVGAVVLIAALVVLASIGAVDADVVGVILGALAGYLFGVSVTQGRS